LPELLYELLERCRRGDRDAAGLLVRRFQRWALDLGTSLLNDEHLAEDAVQAAFVRALMQLGDLHDPAAFPGWLRQIIRTECHRISRRRQNERPMPARGAETLAADGPTPPQHLELHEREQLVRQALSALPEPGQQTAELFYLDQQGCAQVAQQLGVPAGTVKRRLHDARLRLRQLLLGCADEGQEPRAPSPKTKPGQRRLPL
jgi:RNA polymerase sigma-70 factor (ECF subfamily)